MDYNYIVRCFDQISVLSQGVAYLIGKGVLEDSPSAIADFINHTTSLDWKSLSQFLQTRYCMVIRDPHQRMHT